MGYSNTYLSNYLEDTRVTFDNLPNLIEFRAVLTEHGYNDARIQQGAGFHSQSESAHYLFLEKRQLAKAKGKEMVTLFSGMFSVYMRHVKRLKREFAFDQDLLYQLGLVGPRDRKRATAVVQATNFYETAINDAGVFGKLQPLGYTAESLDSDFKKVKEYQSARAEYEKLNGECQELVEKRDKAFKMLRAWMNAFIATCKFAFADNLQALEKAGIFILNRPRPREKKESAANTGTGTTGTDSTGSTDTGTGTGGG
jgi:hypothetical protein